MKGWIVAALVCRGLDAGTSIAAFSHGSREVIPWLPEKPAWVVTVHLGAGTAQTIALTKLQHSHPTRAKVGAGIAAGVECGVAARNLRVSR